jgi:hypothetical protein
MQKQMLISYLQIIKLLSSASKLTHPKLKKGVVLVAKALLRQPLFLFILSMFCFHYFLHFCIDFFCKFAHLNF